MHRLPLDSLEVPTLSDRETGDVLGGPVVVDPLACERLASLLTRQQIPIDEEDSHLEGFSREEAGNYYLLLVAICHQTSPRGRLPLEGTVGGQRRKGWDYLSAKLEGAVRAERSLLYPNVWSHLSVNEFLALFRDRRRF